MKFLLTPALLFIVFNSFSQVDLSFGLIKKSGDTITTDIWMDHQLDIRQFNFEIRGVGGDVTLVGLTPGTAESSLFSLSFADASKKINGFNLAGQSVPKGSSMILGVQFLNPLGVTNVCIENPSISGVTVTLGNCADLSTAIIGIEDPKVSAELEIFPNPMTNTTLIRIPDNLESSKVNIYSSTGNLVRSYSNENLNKGSILVERGNLAAGIYIVQHTGSTGISNSKLIIQ